MPVEDALGAPGLLARLASRWSLGGDAAGPVLLRVRCLITTHVTTRGLSRCLTLHSLCSVETRRVPRTAVSRGQRAPGQFGGTGISESHWLHAKAPVDPCAAPGPAQTEWHRPAGSSLARAGAQPGPTHTRPQQPAGTVPARRAALRFLAPTTLRPNSQSPVIQTAMSADTRCASALKREPTLPMGVGPGGPCRSWHQPSAVVLVAETASPVLPHARTPTTRSSGMGPAPRLLLRWRCAPCNTGVYAGLPALLGRGQGAPGGVVSA